MFKLDQVELALGLLTHGLEHRDDVGVAAAGLDGAAIDEDGWAVQPRHTDKAAGHVLVAAPHGDEAVETLAADHGFDGVRDDLTRHQRILHTLGAIADAVGNGDGVEDDRFAPRRIGTFFGLFCELIDVHVTGGDIGPGRGDTDLRLVEVLVGETNRAQHGTGRSRLDTINHEGGILAHMFSDLKSSKWLSRTYTHAALGQ